MQVEPMFVVKVVILLTAALMILGAATIITAVVLRNKMNKLDDQ